MAKLFKSRQECLEDPDFKTYAELYALVGFSDVRAELVDAIKRNYTAPRKPGKPPPAGSPLRPIFGSKYYQRTDLGCILNTFEYMFDRHKGGFYACIRDNRLRMFIRFNNRRFKNPMTKHLELHPKDAVYVEQQLKMRLNRGPFAIRNDGCFITSAVPTTPGPGTVHLELYFAETKYLLERACESRLMHDCDLFFNFRDQLVLTEDMRAPFFHFFKGDPPVIQEFVGRRMCPIVSYCGRPGYLDVPFPTADETRRIYRLVGKPRCEDQYAVADDGVLVKEWGAKKPTAVFRGSATGCGLDERTNVRIQARRLSDKGIRAPDGVPYMDVVLTGEGKVVFRKHKSERFVRIADTSGQDPAAKLSFAEQSAFKYVLDIEGNVASYRLGNTFGMHSVVLYVRGDYTPWFYHLMKDRVNCVFVRQDLGDLVETLKWCREHDDDCRRIAAAGRAMYERHLGEKGVLDRVQLIAHHAAANAGPG
jgi:hypothetical protein